MVSVDKAVRNGGEKWRWAEVHPHFAFPKDPTNTFYVAAKRLSLPGEGLAAIPGSGVFEYVDDAWRLTARDAKKPSEWSLPGGFFPKGRTPLSYYTSPDRWSQSGQNARLLTVGRGQEFVLDLDLYPELKVWLAKVVAGGRG